MQAIREPAQAVERSPGRTSLRALGILATGLLGAIACGGATSAGLTSTCVVGGDARDQLLLMSPKEADAIVRVDLSAGAEGKTFAATCSGIQLTATWVLTARHCIPVLEQMGGRVHFGGAAPAPPVGATDACGAEMGSRLSVGVDEFVPHPDLDLLLLRLEASPASLGLETSPPRYGGDDVVTAGDLVQLAGFGRTESGGAGSRRFAVEAISRATEASVFVEGNGHSGACAGDSGGPMLHRDLSGAVAVVGVLGNGSKDCLGTDEYVRLSAAAAWLNANLGPPEDPSGSPSCGALGTSGRCYARTAVWCDSGAVAAETCTEPSRCGWSTASAGYRCVSNGDDPCQGISDLGLCSDGTAVRCVTGILASQACDGTCGRSPVTGSVTCQS